jgi:protein TonB
VETPDSIAPEAALDGGLDGGVAGGVEGGVEGGVVGGIIGGLPEAPPTTVKPLRVGGDIREPRKVKHVAPEYPDLAMKARVTGIVIVEALIGPDGRVGSATVLRGVPLLDEAALNAVRQWVYTPTLLNGIPVPVIMTITLRFNLTA